MWAQELGGPQTWSKMQKVVILGAPYQQRPRLASTKMTFLGTTLPIYSYTMRSTRLIEGALKYLDDNVPVWTLPCFGEIDPYPYTWLYFLTGAVLLIKNVIFVSLDDISTHFKLDWRKFEMVIYHRLVGLGLFHLE